jgi:DNA-binding LytR/AlgR family response regulator
LELIKNLGNKKPLIIFTTAKKDYAVEAFELNVVDYLVKPCYTCTFSCRPLKEPMKLLKVIRKK